jgi:hypothetical protein
MTDEQHSEKSERPGLVREEGTVRPRTGRLERGRGDREAEGRTGEGEEGSRRERVRHEHRSGRRGRPALIDEVGDLNRGTTMVAVESVAIAMDVLAKVLRGAVDRAFDEDYSSPGDLVRGLAGEVDLAAYDLVDELRTVPRRLDHRFEDAIRSPRADRGERARREDQSWEKPKR